MRYTNPLNDNLNHWYQIYVSNQIHTDMVILQSTELNNKGSRWKESRVVLMTREYRNKSSIVLFAIS